MKRAVLCLAHRLPEQVNILINQMLTDAPGQVDIYLHIDKKSESMKEQIINNPHVFFIQDSHSVIWGDDSMVKTIVSCFREIKGLNRDYDYFQICTGQDLMVRPGLDRFLEDNDGKIYIYISKNDNYIRNLLLHPYPKCFCRDLGTGFMPLAELAYTLLTRTGLIPSKKLKYDVKNLDMFGSFNWSFMPYAVFKYLAEFFDENPDFLEIYWNSRVPEDGFLGTAIMNSPYRNMVVYKKDGVSGESLTFIKKMKSSHVPLITAGDFDDIEKSGCFMARKFDIEKDPVSVSHYEEMFSREI